MYRSSCVSRCEDLQNSLARMDELLGREIRREREIFEDEKASMEPGELEILDEETYEWEGEVFVFYPARFRRLIRRSNLVTICSFWETLFTDITKVMLNATNSRRVGNAPGLKINNFSGNNICHRCRAALTRYVGVTDDEAIWNDLQVFSRLRNKIVHEGGYVSVTHEGEEDVPLDRKLRADFAKFQSAGLSIGDDGEVIVEPELNELFLRKVQEYLCDILDRSADHFAPPRPVKS